MSNYGVPEVAAENLIAQINSHCKVATLSRENLKIRCENEVLRQMNML
jgi:hypothetical protein